ncbi:OsmC family protein [Alcaligenes nematophilus]|uniref:OsmC family protein n=1 Tax=Alcaligenes nematophilus TaxID=2994643 RepID=UPI00246688E7|nr:OsmC family protein [Alcaligenes nematophilus]MDH4865425.1 OsmC family protein [Bacillus cereus]MDY7126724.1 OsmC family protein [Alcaligenes nematophilus]
MTSETMDLPIAIPTSYGGTGAGSHPKELLMASATACYVMTLAGLIAARKLPLINITVNSVLSDIPKQSMRITHEVFIELPGEATQEQLNASQALIDAADKACMVGNLLKTAGVQLSVSGSVANLQGA